MKSFGHWILPGASLGLVAYACAQGITPPVPLPEPGPPLDPAPLPSVAAAPTVAHSEPAHVTEPRLAAELLRWRAQAQARILGPGNEIEDELGRTKRSDAPSTDAGVPTVNDGNALGSFVAIENDGALREFDDALRRLVLGTLEAQKLRVLAYGASHTQGDFVTGYLRYYLQSRFGNGGLGFVQLAQVNQWYRLLDAKVESNAFRIQHAQRKEMPEHGRFGLLGAAAIGRSSYARASVSPSPRAPEDSLGHHIDLYYMREPGGGDLSFSIDGKEVARLNGRADPAEAGYHTVETDVDWTALSVRPVGNGPIRVFGASVETDRPGIVIDTLGINGTRAANMLLWNEELWSEHVKRRDPRLYLLAYGTNEAVDTKQPITEYEANLRQVIARFKRALPAASCLLVGPGDFPKEVQGEFIARARLLEIIDVQRKLAFESNCAFWDTFEFMGGEGSMQRWVLASPPMAAPDHIHLTARGYVRWGMLLGDALMAPLDAN